MIRRTLILLILILLGMATRASHMSGGEIIWECIGPNEYRITMKIYRDCFGIPVDPAYTLQVQSPCGNTSLVVTTPGGVEISQLCDAQLPNSTCNGGTLPGIQEYIYTGIITLPPCDSWTFSYTNIYRNAAIVNLQNPGAQRTYIRAVMNNSAAPCNDSPQFTNTAIPYVCLGMPYSYSFGVFDPEADSVSYQLISAMGLSGAPLNYVPPYSGSEPIPGLTLDPVTGEVNFTLNQLGNWVVNVQVNHWVNGQLTGTVMRDMQFIAYPCDNIPPDPTTGVVGTMTGVATQTGPRSIVVCESGSFCFDFMIQDPNASNVLTAFSNVQQNLPGSTFTYTGTNPITATVCWTAAQGTQGFFPFIVNVNDGACPIYAFQTYVYSVQVMPGLFADLEAMDANCAGTPGSLTATVTDGTGPFSYLWNTGATGASITGNAGTYSVVIEDASGCISAPIEGTISSTDIPGIAIAGPDIAACGNSSPVQLNGSVQNATGGIWSGGDGSFSGTGPTAVYTPSPTDLLNGSVTLTLSTIGSSPCPEGTDQLTIGFGGNFAGAILETNDVVCNGAANGSASISLPGGGFSFQWNDPASQTTATATGLGSGTYQLTVNDGSGCDTTMSVTINEPSTVIILDMSGNAELCAGDGSGSANVFATGGTAPYTYLWSNGASTQTIAVMSGSYSVVVSDSNGCASSPGEIFLGNSDTPAVVDAGANVTHCATSGPLPLNGLVSNSTSASWSGGAGSFSGTGAAVLYTPTASEIQNGSVTLTLSAINGGACPATVDQVSINFTGSFTGATTSAIDVLCNGGADGSATVNIPGSGFTHSWNDAAAQTGPTATGLTAGTYSVLVTDGSGCDSTFTVTVDEPASVIILDMNGNAEACAGDGNGNASVTVTGGTAPYTFLWSTGALTQTISVTGGTLTVEVSDSNGCLSAPGQLVLGDSDIPATAIAGPDFLACGSALPIALNGMVENAANAYWSGGSGSFSGSGTNVSYMPGPADMQTGSVTLALTATTNGPCPASVDYVNITLSNSLAGLAIGATDVLCNGDANGTATAFANASDLYYEWNDPSAQTTAMATGLSGGIYAVIISDGQGCDTTMTVTIAEPASVIILDMGGNAEQCAGDGTGTAYVMATGGTPPYNYLWSNGAPTQSITVADGNYTVEVIDSNGCISTPGEIFLGESDQPPTANAGPDFQLCSFDGPIALVGSVTNTSSAGWGGGSGTFTGTGSTMHYTPSTLEAQSGSVTLTLTAASNGACPAAIDAVTISLSTGLADLDISATDAMCSGSVDGTATLLNVGSGLSMVWNDPAAQTNITASGLGAGTYAVTVIDVNGCDTTLTVQVGEPGPLMITGITGTGEACSGTGNGNASVAVTGGNAPYTYLWNTGAVSPSINAGSGTYSVTVGDANGCPPVTAQITLDAGAPPNVANAGPDQIACSGDLPLTLIGSVVNASGGTWSGGAGTLIGSGTTVQYMPSQTEIQAGGVDLLLTTTGNDACPSSIDTVHISLSNAFLNALLTASDISCAGTLDGVAAYTPAIPGSTYQWNDPQGQTGPVATGLSPGSWSVQVTDELGCDTTLVAIITEPALLAITMADVQNVTCHGGSDGSLSIAVVGGTPAYNIIWSNGQAGTNNTGLAAGMLAVAVNDANGCALEATFTIQEPAPIQLIVQAPDTVCVNAPVLLSAQASGGAGGYTFNWGDLGLGNTVQTSFATSQLITLSVTDQVGCAGPTETLPITVLDLSNAVLTVYGDTTVCPGGSALVGAYVSGYPGSLTINWPELGSSGTGPFTVPVSGSMTLTVSATDNCGGLLSDVIQLQLETVPTVQFPSIIAEGCAPMTVTFPDLQLPPGTIHQWTLGNGATSAAPMPIVAYGAGVYTVGLSITTPNGCSNSSIGVGQVIVHGPPSVDLTASPWTTDIDNGQVQFTSTTTGSIATYSWTFGDGGTANIAAPAHTYTEIGTFDVELWVMDVNGCTAVVEHPVTITPVYDIVVPNAFSPNANGGTGGGWIPGDLNNDVFYPFVRFVDEFKMRVFNRWGELIFESNNLALGWDGYYRGQLSPQDVYVVQTWVRFVDGKEVKQLSDLTLFR